MKMCKFFSLVSDGKGKIYYFAKGTRKKILNEKISLELDSHTSIAAHFGFKGEDEDKLNKWEYNPLTKELVADHIGTTNDQVLVLTHLKKLDFGKVVPELVIKPIVHPFRDIVPPKKITAKHVTLLKRWDSVGGLVGDSVWNSVWNSVGAYVGSFFILPRTAWKHAEKIKTKGYPFQPAVDLWMMGLVPSFDGKMWRLHGGKDAKTIFEISAEELGRGRR